jgi:Uma2 family endonuclease
MTHSILRMPTSATLTSEQFYDLCRVNPDWKLERTAQGDLVFIAPTGGETGARNANLLIQLGIWNENAQLGVIFDSSTAFHLPNGADRSPDVSWIKHERWNTLTPQQREKFPPLSPDFIIELMSPSDNLRDAQSKMQEYVDNGVQLAWLLNRKDREVEIYQIGKPRTILKQPTQLSGNSILPGFILKLDGFWECDRAIL